MVKTKLKRGDTWRLVFTYTDAAGAPVDLSGASAHMQLRTAADGFPGMVKLSADGLIILAEAKPLTRMIARAFDAYDQTKAQHSAAI
jgi:hypothetical protein